MSIRAMFFRVAGLHEFPFELEIPVTLPPSLNWRHETRDQVSHWGKAGGANAG